MGKKHMGILGSPNLSFLTIGVWDALYPEEAEVPAEESRGDAIGVGKRPLRKLGFKLPEMYERHHWL